MFHFRHHNFLSVLFPTAVVELHCGPAIQILEMKEHLKTADSFFVEEIATEERFWHGGIRFI